MQKLPLRSLGYLLARHFGLSVIGAGVVSSNDGTVSTDGVGVSRRSLAAVVKWSAREGYATRADDGAVTLTEKGRWLLAEFDQRKGVWILEKGPCE